MVKWFLIWCCVFIDTYQRSDTVAHDIKDSSNAMWLQMNVILTRYFTVHTLIHRHVVGVATAPVWRMKGVLYLPENHMHWSCFLSETKRKVVRYLCREVLKRVTCCGHIKSCALAVVLIHFALRVRCHESSAGVNWLVSDVPCRKEYMKIKWEKEN